jgi:spermidine/putrescine transport system substrate-binding protein
MKTSKKQFLASKLVSQKQIATDPERRRALKLALGAASTAAIGPWIVKDARSSSGDLRVMMWSDYLPNNFIAGFEKETGIKLHHISYGSNEELLNKAKAVKGNGFDLVGPTALRALQWRPLEILQPFDMNRVPVDRINKNMLGRSVEHWTWLGKSHHLPYFWGTEALAWRTDGWQQTYDKLSYGDLWRPEFKGKVMGRPHSMMLGIGLYLDRIGKLPSNRMLDAYKDEETMRKIWSVISEFAIAKKSSIKLFWNDAEAQKRGFRKNGVILGQTWDGPVFSLKNSGEAINYMAPQEGALAWLDGLSIPKGAKNFDQIYAFLDYIYRADVGGLLASETGYNSVALGAVEHMTSAAFKSYHDAYPRGAYENLWWWPLEPPWYANARNEYRDWFVAA